MKNRKLVIVAFMLVAAMVMSIGYAAMTGTLTINGKTTYYSPDSDAADGAVVLENANVNNDADVTATVAEGGQSADITIVFDDVDKDETEKTITKTIYFDVTYNYATSTDAVVPNIDVTVNTNTYAENAALTAYIKDEASADITNGKFTLEPNDENNTKTIAVVVTLDVDNVALAEGASSENYSFTLTMDYTNASTASN